MRLSAALPVLVLTAVAPVVAAPPSQAQTGSQPYAAHDAPAAIDIVRLTVRNGARRVRLSAEVRRPGHRGVFVFLYWGGRRATPPARSLLVAVRLVDGEAEPRLFACGLEDCARSDCTGVRATRGQEDMTVSVPQRCYPGGVPDEGRFSVWSHAGARSDGGQAEPLLLSRG